MFFFYKNVILENFYKLLWGNFLSTFRPKNYPYENTTKATKN